MLWFTSDTHFGHSNALHFTDRPWRDVAQMNRDMVEGINARVAPDDDLYILGDYSFKMTAEAAAELRDRINCRNVHLIPGNHDKDWTQPAIAGTFIVEPPILKLNIHGQRLILSHFPLMDWPSMAHGSWHLHGHVHSSGTVYNELNRRQGLMRYDVGVDANGYTPVSLDEIRAWFAGVEYCGRARWWDWVNGTCDPQVVSACNLVREVMCELAGGYQTAQESAEAARVRAAKLREMEI